jgi:hypothetical protein
VQGNRWSSHAIGIDLIHIRRENILSLAGKGVNIGIESSGIAIKVFAGSKLQWVHKDGDHNNICEFMCSGHQCEVALVQCPHGGNKSKSLTLCRKAFSQSRHFNSGVKNLGCSHG